MFSTLNICINVRLNILMYDLIIRRSLLNIFNEEKLFELTNSLSKQFFNKPFKHTIMYNDRLRTTGGRYIPSKKMIEINPKYVVEMGYEEVVGIIKHELCHYHLHIEGKGYKHGDRAFKQLLRATGSPRYCAPLPSEKNRRTYKYKCHKCHYIYVRKRRMNINKYRCGRCNGNIYLTDI